MDFHPATLHRVNQMHMLLTATTGAPLSSQSSSQEHMIVPTVMQPKGEPGEQLSLFLENGSVGFGLFDFILSSIYKVHWSALSIKTTSSRRAKLNQMTCFRRH